MTCNTTENKRLRPKEFSEAFAKEIVKCKGLPEGQLPAEGREAPELEAERPREGGKGLPPGEVGS